MPGMPIRMVSSMGRNKNLIRANVCMEPDGVTWFQVRWESVQSREGKVPQSPSRVGRTAASEVLPRTLEAEMPHLTLGRLRPAFDLGEQYCVGWVERSDTHQCRWVWRRVSLRSTHPT